MPKSLDAPKWNLPMEGNGNIVLEFTIPPFPNDIRTPYVLTVYNGGGTSNTSPPTFHWVKGRITSATKEVKGTCQANLGPHSYYGFTLPTIVQNTFNIPYSATSSSGDNYGPFVSYCGTLVRLLKQSNSTQDGAYYRYEYVTGIPQIFRFPLPSDFYSLSSPIQFTLSLTNTKELFPGALTYSFTPQYHADIVAADGYLWTCISSATANVVTTNSIYILSPVVLSVELTCSYLDQPAIG